MNALVYVHEPIITTSMSADFKEAKTTGLAVAVRPRGKGSNGDNAGGNVKPENPFCTGAVAYRRQQGIGSEES